MALAAGPTAPYVGRFAPSPTGPLHAGSLVAALASWLDARAQAGTWLVRLEDVDTPRCVPGADLTILQQLAACGLHPDQTPLRQSQRGAAYQQALDALLQQGRAYPCACSRKDVETALAALGAPRTRHGELVYPGTCRTGLGGREARAWRFRLPSENDSFFGSNQPPDPVPSMQYAIKIRATYMTHWHDRRLGAQAQDVAATVGDFVLKRADGLCAYQLAVVVDDAAQGVTHVVRGEDLADNTARQIVLQAALGLPQPSYLHTPLVLGDNGEKLSKQNGAQALNLADPLAALRAAAAVLGLQAQGHTVADALARWVAEWRASYNLARDCTSTPPR